MIDINHTDSIIHNAPINWSNIFIISYWASTKNNLAEIFSLFFSTCTFMYTSLCILNCLWLFPQLGHKIFYVISSTPVSISNFTSFPLCSLIWWIQRRPVFFTLGIGHIVAKLIQQTLLTIYFRYFHIFSSRKTFPLTEGNIFNKDIVQERKKQSTSYI